VISELANLAVFSNIQSPQAAPTEQLLLYARDLRIALQREREKHSEVQAISAQLQSLNEELERALASERERCNQVQQAHHDTLLRLVRASRLRDDETGSHIKRVSAYALVLARLYGMSEEDAQVISAATPMHDVGKIGVPDAILLKPGPLNEHELRIMQEHPSTGARLLSGSESKLLQAAYDIALTHHERWDGSGYPNGLRGTEIPLAGRIVMLADQYDALRSARPYKPAYPHEIAREIIVYGDGRTSPDHFDPDLLAIFKRTHQEFAAIYDAQWDTTSW
jgi:putative two-component system response regulator